VRKTVTLRLANAPAQLAEPRAPAVVAPPVIAAPTTPAEPVEPDDEPSLLR
jgi:hypothetical protein